MLKLPPNCPVFWLRKPYPWLFLLIVAGWHLFHRGLEVMDLQTRGESVRRMASTKKILSLRLSSAIEMGGYFRVKGETVRKCSENKDWDAAERSFCEAGWHFVASTQYIEKTLGTKVLDDESLPPAPIQIESAEAALGFGGALIYKEGSLSRVRVDEKWKPYISQGIGFFSLFITEKLGIHIPMTWVCDTHSRDQACYFGAGMAGFLASHEKPDPVRLPAAARGYEIAEIFNQGTGPGREPQAKLTKAQLFAASARAKPRPLELTLSECLLRKQPTQCF